MWIQNGYIHEYNITINNITGVFLLALKILGTSAMQSVQNREYEQKDTRYVVVYVGNTTSAN